jgi:hypothetical protein
MNFMTFEQAIAALRAAVREKRPDPITVGVGRTGYLDRPFVPDSPASWGTDSFGRPFVTLCLRWRASAGMVGHWEGAPAELQMFAVNTIFQRYAEGAPRVWVAARNVGHDPFSPGEMKLAEIVQLIGIVRGQRVEGPIDGLALADPADVRRAHDWGQEDDAPDQAPAPGAAAHAERPQILESFLPFRKRGSGD